MIHEIMEIEGASLCTYFLDSSPEMRPDEKRPVVVVCPGGGYAMTSDREAEPIAMQFLAMGCHAVILRYSVSPEEYPKALCQLGSTVKFLKEHAKEYHIDPDKVILQGASAGGHLAASFGVFWSRKEMLRSLHSEREELKPAGMILCYPVITSGRYAHEGSFHNLLGNRYEQLKGELSLENQVTEDTPPTFLWHTATDQTVPVENSLLFFAALKNAGVPAELHIYPRGDHGLSLASYETSCPNGFGIQKECQSWIHLARTWLEQFQRTEK